MTTKRARQREVEGVGGGGTVDPTHAVFHMSRKHTSHKHALLLTPAACCGVLQDLSFLSAPSLSLCSRYSIKSSRDVLENWPLFPQRLEGEERGREGRRRWRRRGNMVRLNLSKACSELERVRGQTERLIIYMLSTAVSQMKGPLVNFTATLKEQPLQHWALGCGTHSTYYTLKIIFDKTTPSGHFWRQDWHQIEGQMLKLSLGMFLKLIKHEGPLILIHLLLYVDSARALKTLFRGTKSLYEP